MLSMIASDWGRSMFFQRRVGAVLGAVTLILWASLFTSTVPRERARAGEIEAQASAE